jgi:hypothetical protein
VLRLVPESWLTWNFDVLDNDRKITEIKTSTLPESGRFSIEGSEFHAHREGMFSGEFFLEKDGEIVARAQKPSALKSSFDIEFSDRRYTLKKESWAGRSFVLLQGDLEVGSIRPEGMLTRKATVQLPDDLPIPLQVFVMWLTILLWKREADAGAAASVAAST